jgi:hypothetical protein
LTRDVSAALITASQAAIVRPFMAVDMDYPDGAVRVCSLDRAVTFGGHDWYAVGALGAVSQVEEGSENRSYGFNISVSGVPGSFNEYLRSQDVQGRLVTVYLGFVDSDYSIIGYDIVTVGRMDTQDVQAGQTTSVTVQCESIQVDWERPRVRRCTDADHRSRHSTDGFFQYVAALQNLDLRWGK